MFVFICIYMCILYPLIISINSYQYTVCMCQHVPLSINIYVFGSACKWSWLPLTSSSHGGSKQERNGIRFTLRSLNNDRQRRWGIRTMFVSHVRSTNVQGKFPATGGRGMDDVSLIGRRIHWRQLPSPWQPCSISQASVSHWSFSSTVLLYLTWAWMQLLPWPTTHSLVDTFVWTLKGVFQHKGHVFHLLIRLGVLHCQPQESVKVRIKRAWIVLFSTLRKERVWCLLVLVVGFLRWEPLLVLLGWLRHVTTMLQCS